VLRPAGLDRIRSRLAPRIRERHAHRPEDVALASRPIWTTDDRHPHPLVLPDEAANGRPRQQPLIDADLALLDAYWRAANYLSVGQIYLMDNPLLAEPLRPEHIKPRARFTR